MSLRHLYIADYCQVSDSLKEPIRFVYQYLLGKLPHIQPSLAAAKSVASLQRRCEENR